MKKFVVLFMALGLALVALPVMAQTTDVPDANAEIFSNAATNNDNSVVQGQTAAGVQVPISLPGDSEPSPVEGSGGSNMQAQNAANNGSTATQGMGNNVGNTVTLTKTEVDVEKKTEVEDNKGNTNVGTGTQTNTETKTTTLTATKTEVEDNKGNTNVGSGTQTNTDNSIDVKVKAKNAAYGTANAQDNEVEKGGVLNAGSGTVDQSETTTTNVALNDNFKKGKYVQNSAAVTENNQKGKYNINGDNNAPISDYQQEGKYNIMGANSAPINDASKGGTIVTGSGNATNNEVEKGGVLQNGSGNIAGIEVEKGGTLTNGNDNAIGNEKSIVDSTFNTALNNSLNKGKYVTSNNNNEQKAKNANYSGTQTVTEVKGKYAANGTQTVTETNNKQKAFGKNVNNTGTQTVNETNNKQKGKNNNFSGTQTVTETNYEQKAFGKNINNAGTQTVNETNVKGKFANVGSGTQTNTENNWDAKGKYAINGVGTVTEVNNKGKYVKSVIFKDEVEYKAYTKTDAEVSGKVFNNLQAISTTQLSQANTGVVVGDYSPHNGNVAVNSSGQATNGVVAMSFNGAGSAVNQATLNVVNVAHTPTQTMTNTLTFTKTINPPPTQ